LPMALAPGATFTFDVSFVPESEGKYAGTVRISSNDKNAPDANVALNGLAVGGEFVLAYAGRNPVLAEVGAPVEIPVQTKYRRGLVTYQWYRVTPNKALEVLTGQTGDKLILFHAGWDDAGNYQCVATDSVAGSASSPVIKLEVVEELPVSGLMALGALAVTLALAGVRGARRRERT